MYIAVFIAVQISRAIAMPFAAGVTVMRLISRAIRPGASLKLRQVPDDGVVGVISRAIQPGPH